MENNIFSKMPVNWTVCMQADCPLHGGCLRYQAFEHIKTLYSRQSCVLPSARDEKGCRYHIPFVKVQVAWGMRELLSDIKKSDARQMRAHIKALFRSHSTYYRYYNGHYSISPRQQQAIRRIFKSFGYDPDCVRFDRVERNYFFPQS
ncbi:MAG: hypothetical protein IJ209_08195 [Bacteroidaceae bacterium]|nr:hypothetical protein [Bacteroidaceae bacterium]